MCVSCVCVCLVHVCVLCVCVSCLVSGMCVSFALSLVPCVFFCFHYLFSLLAVSFLARAPQPKVSGNAFVYHILTLHLPNQPLLNYDAHSHTQTPPTHTCTHTHTRRASFTGNEWLKMKMRELTKETGSERGDKEAEVERVVGRGGV